MSTPGSVQVQVAGKINPILRVGPQREGFHQLWTLFQSVSVCEAVTATLMPEGEATAEYPISLTWEFLPDSFAYRVAQQAATPTLIPTDPRNVAVAAALELWRRCGVGPTPPATQVQVRKAVPVAAGMAGGSADAAAALLACAQLWELDLSPEDLAQVAAEIGSDVPFVLTGGTAQATGRGVQLEPVQAGTFHWVLAHPGGELGAGQVYAQLRTLRQAGRVPARETPEPSASWQVELRAVLAAADAAALATLVHNDLDAAAVALKPELSSLLSKGKDAGALAGLVSGSGPTCAFLGVDERHAAAIVAHLSDQGYVVQQVRTASPRGGTV